MSAEVMSSSENPPEAIEGRGKIRVEGSVGGVTLALEAGHIAYMANGAVVAQYGDNVLLATAVMSETPVEDADFFPLTVEFEAKTYAAGKIPVSFFRREGRPGEKSILVARLTDRPLRPLFPEGMRNEVQIVVTALCADPVHPPEPLSVIAASAALAVSDIPFAGPVGAVRMGRIQGELVINPTYPQMQESDLDLLVAGTREAINMVEAGANEVPEEVILEAMQRAHEVIREIVALQEELARQAGKPKREVPLYEPDEELLRRVEEWAAPRLRPLLGRPGKMARQQALQALEEELVALLLQENPEAYADREREIRDCFHRALKKVVRKMTLHEGIRVDGRRPEEIRPIHCQVGLFPRTHGSALFTRGETQVITIATLGGAGDEKVVDWLTEDTTSHFMHHYNHPPYSTGEAKPLRGPGRREIGHGALAERALLAVLPDNDAFPYTIRLVSEVVSSNGSTSMASVCGSSLALMDAGVPIRTHVAGVAMGLMREEGQVLVLTDIEGMEDFCGDMDFKVAGTDQGVTALQMDIKIEGLTWDIIRQALEQARRARLVIREKMLATLAQPRPCISPYAPRMAVIRIDPRKIGLVIGSGGRTINQITLDTNTKIEIQQDGKVLISGPSEEAVERAKKIILDMTREVVAGEVYQGRVTRIMNFGAFVEILPGREGLLHISRLAPGRIERVEDAVNIGDTLEVRVREIDSQGRISLERTDLPPRPEPARTPQGPRSPGPRPPFDRGRPSPDRRGPERGGGGRPPQPGRGPRRP